MDRHNVDAKVQRVVEDWKRTDALYLAEKQRRLRRKTVRGILLALWVALLLMWGVISRDKNGYDASA